LFAKYTSDKKNLVSKIYKELLKFSNKTQEAEIGGLWFEAILGKS
jgi:hypothetical protein